MPATYLRRPFSHRGLFSHLLKINLAVTACLVISCKSSIVAKSSTSPNGASEKENSGFPTDPAATTPIDAPSDTPTPEPSIAPPNLLPTASVSLMLNFSRSRVTCSTAGSVTDPDGDPLTLQFKLKRKRSGLETVVATSKSGQFYFKPGFFRSGDDLGCSLEANDGKDTAIFEAQTQAIGHPMPQAFYLNANISGQKFSETRLVALRYGAGFVLFDTTDPTNPVELDALPKRRGFTPAISGSRIISVDGFLLENVVRYKIVIVGLDSTGNHLIELGDYLLPSGLETYSNPVAAGDKLFLYVKPAGLMIFDVSSPGAITKIGEGRIFPNDNSWGTVAYHSSGHVIISSWEDISRLRIVDVTNPASPTVAGTHLDAGSQMIMFRVHNNVLYAKNRWSGIKTWNLNSLPSLTLADNLNTTSVVAWSDGEMDIEGNLIVTPLTQKLALLNIDNLELPTVLGSARGSDFGAPRGNFSSVHKFGNKLIALNEGNGMHVFDATNAAAISEVSHQKAFSFARSIAFKDDETAIVADSKIGLVSVKFGATGATPLNAYYTATEDTTWVRNHNNRIIATAGNYGVVELSVSAEGAFSESRRFDTPGKAVHTSATSDRLFVADETSGFHVFELANLTNKLGTGVTLGKALAVIGTSTSCYVAEDSAGAGIYDCSNPAAISRTAIFDFTDTTEKALSVAPLGNKLLVLSDKAKLYSVALDNIGAATLVPVDTPLILAGAVRLIPHDNAVYLGDSHHVHKLVIVGGLPTVEYSTPVADLVHDIAFKQNALYMASGRAFIGVFE